MDGKFMTTDEMYAKLAKVFEVMKNEFPTLETFTPEFTLKKYDLETKETLISMKKVTFIFKEVK